MANQGRFERLLKSDETGPVNHSIQPRKEGKELVMMGESRLIQRPMALMEKSKLIKMTVEVIDDFGTSASTRSRPDAIGWVD